VPAWPPGPPCQGSSGGLALRAPLDEARPGRRSMAIKLPSSPGSRLGELDHPRVLRAIARIIAYVDFDAHGTRPR
jgi:hypothetical protein